MLRNCWATPGILTEETVHTRGRTGSTERPHVLLWRVWGNAESGIPPVLLVRGTGFVAEVWEDMARILALNHVVCAT